MQHRMTKSSKVIAYIVGFVVLSLSPFENLTMVYGLGGTAWLIVWILRNNNRDIGSAGQHDDDVFTRQRMDRYLNDRWTREYHN